MLSTAESIFVILSVVAASIGFLYLLNLFWPPQRRSSYNSIFAWQVSFLGTTYGVIISFMLFAAWTSFYDAEVNADAEANSLVNLARVSSGLPPAQRDATQKLALRYADVVLSDEWPAMSHSVVSLSGRAVIGQIWSTLTSGTMLTTSQQVALDHALTELSSMTEHRRIRQLEAVHRLPSILWAVLVLGSILTISYACLFGAENFTLHALQVLGLALLIALSLAAIADLSRPFQGGAHIKPDAFVRARDSIQPRLSGH